MFDACLVATRLSSQAYVTQTRSLRKVFVSIKGFYYQARPSACAGFRAFDASQKRWISQEPSKHVLSAEFTMLVPCC
eukprot:3021739-Pleurochrysis_carterae.AAC.1